ncbi:MAG: glycosyltransferase family 39 protein [Actinobacteria bacterium]|nr:glycosyltransferase family 39 protein [Actinomycetota bacterium]
MPLRSSRLRQALPGLLVGLGAALLALPHALHDPLWQDEVASARILGEPTLAALVHRVGQTESTPPLWYALGWVVHRAGFSIVEVRLVSVAAIGATAAAVVALARRVAGRTLSVVAGLIVACGSQFAQHAHELRAYALLTFLSVVFAWLLESSVTRPTRWRLAALACCTAAGDATHYFFLLTLAAGVVWLLWEADAAAVRRRVLAAVLMGAAVSLAVVPLALSQYAHDHIWWIGAFALDSVLSVPMRMFWPFQLSGVGGAVVRLAVFALVLASAWRLRCHSRHARCYAVLALGPMVAAGLLWLLGLRIFAFRNLIETGPFFALVLVGGLALLSPFARAVSSSVVVVLVVAGYAWSQSLPTTPYNAIAHALVAEGWHAPQPIAVFGDFFDFRSPLEWYLPHDPELGLAVPERVPCRTLFAVIAADTRLARRHAVSYLREGGFDVERVRLANLVQERHFLRDAALLGDPQRPPGCARVVRRGRYAAVV